MVRIAHSGVVKVEPDPNWVRFAERILEQGADRRVYVVGGVDAGKSTFCDFLARRFGELGTVAYVDLDCGQARVGPPTTVGAKLPHSRLLRFIGSTSPPGHLLELVGGAARLTEEANRHARRCIIDSSGYVNDAAAVEFQVHLIDVLRPDCVVLLGGGRSVERIGSAIEHTAGLTVERVPSSQKAENKSPAARSEYRAARFADYFRDVETYTVSFKELALRGRIPNLKRPPSYVNRLCALCDGDRFVVTLAVLDAVDLESRSLILRGPAHDRSAVRSVHFGSLHLNPDTLRIEHDSGEPA